MIGSIILTLEAFFCDDALYKLTFPLHYIALLMYSNTADSPKWKQRYCSTLTELRRQKPNVTGYAITSLISYSTLGCIRSGPGDLLILSWFNFCTVLYCKLWTQAIASKSTSRLSNPVFTETEKPGNPEFFSKPKNRFLAACKPGFSDFNFDLQMSHYATILTQTAYNVHDSMFLCVYIYHWRPGPAQGLHSTRQSHSSISHFCCWLDQQVCVHQL